MGISRTNRNKRTSTGGKKRTYCKKRKHSLARQTSSTRIGEERIKSIRVRGGNEKLRALRLNNGVFTIKSHGFTFDAKILQVVYHPTSNELMRTNTLTKSAVLQIESPEAKQFIEGVGSKEPTVKELDPFFFESNEKGNLYAIVTSRPGQVGKADGYVLQGNELQFYVEKLKKKKSKAI
ncbi:ribosomal protein S8 [Hamiltosporidium magnivora]|uniref:40S ribosomal protein S8 n=1 Tax=Hamiltosporidium magnivora TaxID=148818 RepID=A0A4Q9KUW6_9MICR|nr:ribosomal protein S8 [Hamiltosporidium magnivora]